LAIQRSVGEIGGINWQLRHSLITLNRSRFDNPVSNFEYSFGSSERLGGLNLYSLLKNNSIGEVDYLGLCVVGSTRVQTTDALFDQTNCGNSSYTQSVSFGFSLWGFGGGASTSVTVNPCKRMVVTASYNERCEEFSWGGPGPPSTYTQWVYDSFRGFNPTESDGDCD
jgi:hypothetical protein